VLFRSYYDLGCISDINATEDFITTQAVTSLASPQILPMIPDREYQVCRALSVIFEHNYAFQNFNILSLAYTLRQMSDETAKKVT
jgi:hypothetical protein